MPRVSHLQSNNVHPPAVHVATHLERDVNRAIAAAAVIATAPTSSVVVVAGNGAGGSQHVDHAQVGTAGRHVQG